MEENKNVEFDNEEIQEENNQSPNKKKPLIIIGILVAVLVIVLVGLLFLSKNKENKEPPVETPPIETITPTPAPVETKTPEPEDNEPIPEVPTAPEENPEIKVPETPVDTFKPYEPPVETETPIETEEPVIEEPIGTETPVVEEPKVEKPKPPVESEKPKPSPKPTEKPKEEKPVKPVKPNTGDTINIGGVDVPLVDEYVPANKETDGWFANDEKGNSPYYDATNKFNDYIHSKVDNKISVAKDASTVIYTDDNISVAFNGVHDLEYAFKLNKNADKNQYELTIATRLYPGSKYEEEANNTLKLLLAAFTNEVDSLYEVLYTHYEEDDTIISKTKWTQIGSVKVKYDIVGSNNVVYYFKK